MRSVRQVVSPRVIFSGLVKELATWGCTGLFGTQLDVHFNSFLDLLWSMLMIQSCNEEQLSLAVTLAWCLWNNRNECRHVGRGRVNGNWCSGLGIIYWSIKLRM